MFSHFLKHALLTVVEATFRIVVLCKLVALALGRHRSA